MSTACAMHADTRLARSVALAEQRRQVLESGIRAVLDWALALWERRLEWAAVNPDEAAAIYSRMTVLDHQTHEVQRAVRGSHDLAESSLHSPALRAKIGAAASAMATVASSLNAALHCLTPRVATGDVAGRSLSACLQMATRFLRTSLQASSTLAGELTAAATMCRPGPPLPAAQAQP
ncbi:hypothetical protein ACQP1U_09940 [Actinomycetota bacterium]